MVRILLAEDHVLVRQSIRSFLENENVQVIGEAGTGLEAVEMALSLQPDIVIMDIHLPQISGIEATRRIRQDNPNIHIIALTAYNEKAYQRALLDIGVKSFVLKTAELSELLTQIQRITGSSKAKTSPQSTNPLHTAKHELTERELDVLVCVARGWTNKQVGSHLNISDRTVQVHLQAIYHKLEVGNRTEAVLKAIVLGLITPIDGEQKWMA